MTRPQPDNLATANTPAQMAASVTLRQRLPSLLPLAATWIAALLPVALYGIYHSNPEFAVVVALQMKQWSLRILMLAIIATAIGVIFYPPLPAWLRRLVDRTRTKWSADRAPLLRALSELKHFETAQKHFEVAKLAWIRCDYELTGVHIRRSVQLDPSLPAAQYLLGKFALSSDARTEALSAFTAAEHLDTGHAFGSAQLHKAHLQHLTGNLSGSLQTFASYFRKHGGSHRSNYWHAEALLDAGQNQAAAVAFQTAAADPKMRLNSEENWFRARARVRCWRITAKNSPSNSGGVNT